jgi:hypothetical protein
MIRLCLACFAVLGCRGFVEPDSKLLAKLRALPSPAGPYLRLKSAVTVESPWLSGNFDGVIVASPGPSPRVRAQWFPDLGGKALDLLAQPDRIVGYLPRSQEALDFSPTSHAGPHPLLLMGITLLEHFAPLSEARVLGMQETDDGWWVELKPVVEGCRVTAFLRADGAVLHRKFERGVRWEQRIRPGRDITIDAPGLTLRADDAKPQELSTVPAGLFELNLPGSAK